MAISLLLVLNSMLFNAFNQDHAGATPASLVVSAGWNGGPVVNDGLCTYDADTKRGCYDPTAGGAGGELACSDPAVLSFGVVWLYLHAAVYAPFGDGPVRRAELPLWAYAAAPSAAADAVYVWGMGTVSARQELWRWQPGAAPEKLLDGPAEESGGISAWPKEPDCLALASYAGTDQLCAGQTTIWKWCAAQPGALTPVRRFRGCSGQILAAADAIWNLQAGRATV
jgi:hypothetical protein